MKIRLITFMVLFVLATPADAFHELIPRFTPIVTQESLEQTHELGRQLQRVTGNVQRVTAYPGRAQRKISAVLSQVPIFIIDGKINAIMDFSGGGFKATVIYHFK